MNVQLYRSRTALLPALLVAVAGLVFGGCGSDDKIVPPEPPVPDPAGVRVIHLSPDAPEVDVYVNSTILAFEDVAFQDGTARAELPAGTYSFQVVETGEPPDPAVLSFDDVPLAAGVSYTAVAYDTLENITGLALVDDFTSPGTGIIRVRAIHTAVGVGLVDIWAVTDPPAEEPLYEGVDFGDVGGYFGLPAGSYTLGFDVGQTGELDLLFDTGPIPAGSIINIFAVNDGEDVFLLAQFQDDSVVRINATPPPPPDAQIRVIHLSPDAPPVDVYVNSTILAFEDVPFEDGTARAELPAGTYSFQVVATGAPPDPAVLSFDDVPLAAGVNYTAVAYDTLGNIKGLALVDDFSDPGVDTIRVRAIHTAVDVGLVDIWAVTDPPAEEPLYEGVDFGDVGGYFGLPAGSYTLGFDVGQTGELDLLFDTGELPAGSIVNIFAVSDDGLDVFLLAQFQDDSVVRIGPNP